MPTHIYDGWCNLKVQAVAAGRQLHFVSEIPGVRAKAQKRINNTVLSHYEDPDILADRIKRLGFTKASKILNGLLPKTKKARSGHIGEILATETVAAILPGFVVPISRLRWLDGRDTAMRGEDVIAILRTAKRTRFLKGESKSRVSLSPGVVTAARKALCANKGRPSQHAMAFVMRQLLAQGDTDLALVFENYLLLETIQEGDLVHLLFGFSGNDASAALEADLRSYSGKIEQHSVNLRIVDHPAFVASLYQP